MSVGITYLASGLFDVRDPDIVFSFVLLFLFLFFAASGNVCISTVPGVRPSLYVSNDNARTRRNSFLFRM